MKRFAALLGLFLALAALEARAAIVFNDGEFTAWTFGAAGNSLASRDPSGGNPGARMVVVTNSQSGTTYGYGYKSDYSTDIVLEGTTFTVTIDILGASSLQAVELIVEQAGSVYRKSIGDTGTRAIYTPVAFTGTLTAASFVKIAGNGPLQPNLSGGVSTRFGIAGGNTFSPQIAFSYDNVRLNLAAIAGTDPCAGFSDVASDASFCQATIWLRNRGITTGCTTTQYCPDGLLTRAQMALFMNRLGKALAPETLHKQALLQNLVLPNENTPPGLLVCSTNDFATGGYARTAQFTGSYAAYPNLLPVVINGYWRYSTDSGATWNYVGNWQVDVFPAPAVANQGGVANSTVLAPTLSLAPNSNYRFGLFVNGGSNDNIQASILVCSIQVTILTPP